MSEAAATSAPLDPASTAGKVVRNALWNTLNFVVTLPIGLYLTPFVMVHLGDANFGIWSMVGTFTGLAGLASLGIPGALTHFVAHHWARHEIEIIDRKVNTAFVLYFALVALMLPPLWVSMGPLAKWFFEVDPARLPEIVLYLRIVVTTFLVSLVFTAHYSIIGGMQRFDLVNMVSIGMSLLSLGGTVWLLSAGYGLRGLVWFSALQTALTVAVNWTLMKRLLPAIGFRPWLFCRGDAAEILGFSMHIFLASLSALLHAQMDKLLIGHFLPIRFAGYYQVPTDLVTKARSIPLTLIGPVMAATSELQSLAQFDAVRKLYVRGLRYVLLAGTPGFVWLWQFAEPFVTTWIGPDHGEIVLTLKLLAVANLVNVATGPGGQVISGLGHPKYVMALGLGGMALNLVFTLAAIRDWGYLAVVLGMAVGLVVSSAVFMPLVHRRIGVSTGLVFLECVKLPLLAASAASAVVHLSGMLEWCTSFSRVLATVPAYSVLYGLALLAMGFPSEEDRRVFERHSPLKRWR